MPLAATPCLTRRLHRATLCTCLNPASWIRSSSRRTSAWARSTPVRCSGARQRASGPRAAGIRMPAGETIPSPPPVRERRAGVARAGRGSAAAGRLVRGTARGPLAVVCNRLEPLSRMRRCRRVAVWVPAPRAGPCHAICHAIGPSRRSASPVLGSSARPYPGLGPADAAPGASAVPAGLPTDVAGHGGVNGHPSHLDGHINGLAGSGVSPVGARAGQIDPGSGLASSGTSTAGYDSSRPPSGRESDEDDEDARASSVGSSRQAFPFRRSYKACLHCRERKVKCDLGSLDNPSDPPCARCKREGRRCEFLPSRRGGAKNVRAGKAKAVLYEGAGAAAARAAVPPAAGYRRLAGSGGPDSIIKQKDLLTTADALNILAHVADTAEGKDRRDADHLSTLPQPKRLKSDHAPVRRAFRTAKLASFEPIRSGILTEEETTILVNFFFETLHRFHPYVPPGLHPLTNLAAHPILLVAILSIASRYHSLPDVSSAAVSAAEYAPGALSPRSKQVHTAIWTYTESLISRTVWAEASHVSIATVVAFLLLSEWNPRAVHFKNGDYANSADISAANDDDNKGGDDAAGGGYRGFAAARRSDRMAWLMIGTAIRLAQDLNLFNKCREICISCFYADITLALRLGRPSMLSYTFQETPTVMFSTMDNAKIEILQILSFAHQSLYSSPQSMHKILDSESYLPLLKYFRSKLRAWHTKYSPLFRENDIETETLLLEFHHAELYIYSLALSPPGHRQADESLAELYILYAYQAAIQCVNVIKRVHGMGQLKWAPIRWFIRLVHVAVFLAKVFALERDPDRERQVDIIQTIREMATVLRASTPDEIHMATKYAAALCHLVNQLEASLMKKQAEEEAALAGTTPGGTRLESYSPDASGPGPAGPPDRVPASGHAAADATPAPVAPAPATPAPPHVLPATPGNLHALGLADGHVLDDDGMQPTVLAAMDDTKWFIESFGMAFDGNYALDDPDQFTGSWASPADGAFGEGAPPMIPSDSGYTDDGERDYGHGYMADMGLPGGLGVGGANGANGIGGVNGVGSVNGANNVHGAGSVGGPGPPYGL
ncbi:uncharacterized protein V1510DRAFT_447973 [Dipodascopsis tothii]|uniref:uncharacterized protein n=1 Tax=Dipodascopsis tothii TaxID=44089 RepID=UPI0034CEEC5D